MSKKPRYQEIDGLRLPLPLTPEVFRSALTYQPEKGDVIVMSYPGCGADWVSQVVHLILRGGRPCSTAEEYFTSVPFLEILGAKGLKYTMKPRCIKTHLPCRLINFSHKAKYIYVARNPWQSVVSFYNHTRLFPTYFFSDGSFGDFLDLFVKGEVEYGCYFDHVMSGYRLRYNNNVLFITYESIKSNPKESVLQIARFLDEKYYRDLTIAANDKTLKDIIYCSSLEYVRSTIDGYWKEIFVDAPPSEELQALYPVVKKYVQLMKEAESDGHQSVSAEDGEITFSSETSRKLDDYIKKYDYDEYDDDYYLMKEFRPR